MEEVFILRKHRRRIDGLIRQKRSHLLHKWLNCDTLGCTNSGILLGKVMAAHSHLERKRFVGHNDVAHYIIQREKDNFIIVGGGRSTTDGSNRPFHRP